MKKAIYSALLLSLMIIFAGCSNKEDNVQAGGEKETTSVQETKKSEVHEEPQASQGQTEESPKFEIIETVNMFGGGTFDLNQDISDPGAIYITEDQEDVYLNIVDNYFGEPRAVLGNKDSWVSISESVIGTNDRMYPRGQYLFQEENNELTTGNFYNDMTFSPGSETIPFTDSLYLTNTSKGEGFILENEDEGIYTVYVMNDLAEAEPVMEFKDVKEIMDMVPDQIQRSEESQVFVDIELKKLYFIESGFIYQLDLETGKPLFENGEMKKIATTGGADIIGNADGNLFVVEAGDQVMLSVYNYNLDLLNEAFEVPVENPHDIAVTLTLNEIHIWDVHEYELDPVLELVRLSKPFNFNSDPALAKLRFDTEDEKNALIGKFFEAITNKDKKAFRSYLVDEFGEEGKDIQEEQFLTGNISYGVLDITESNDAPQEETMEAFNVDFYMTDGERDGRGKAEVTLSKENGVWKIYSVY